MLVWRLERSIRQRSGSAVEKFHISLSRMFPGCCMPECCHVWFATKPNHAAGQPRTRHSQRRTRCCAREAVAKLAREGKIRVAGLYGVAPWDVSVAGARAFDAASFDAAVFSRSIFSRLDHEADVDAACARLGVGCVAADPLGALRVRSGGGAANGGDPLVLLSSAAAASRNDAAFVLASGLLRCGDVGWPLDHPPRVSADALGSSANRTDRFAASLASLARDFDATLPELALSHAGGLRAAGVVASVRIEAGDAAAAEAAVAALRRDLGGECFDALEAARRAHEPAGSPARVAEGAEEREEEERWVGGGRGRHRGEGW